jgi:hypothetical protein
VLRAFLPTCNAEELARFLGPIGSVLLEDAEPTALRRFAADGGRLSARSFPVHP